MGTNKAIIKTTSIMLIVFGFFTISSTGFGWSEAVAADLCDKYYSQAMALFHIKQIKEAERVYSIGISKCPNDAKLYFQRAKLRQNYLRNCQGAILDYSVVIKLNPKTKIYHPKSYYKRGLCWYKSGSYLQALSDFSNCIKLNPNYDGRVYMARARAFGKIGMTKRAKQDLELCVKRDSKYGRGARASAIRSLMEKIISGRTDQY